MRVKALIEFKGKLGFKYIGNVSKKGVFHFRNKQLRKSCLKRLENDFHNNPYGGSLVVPDPTNERIKWMFKLDGYLTCYSSPPEKENRKYIATYWKPNN